MFLCFPAFLIPETCPPQNRYRWRNQPASATKFPLSRRFSFSQKVWHEERGYHLKRARLPAGNNQANHEIYDAQAFGFSGLKSVIALPFFQTTPAAPINFFVGFLIKK